MVHVLSHIVVKFGIERSTGIGIDMLIWRNSYLYIVTEFNKGISKYVYFQYIMICRMLIFDIFCFHFEMYVTSFLDILLLYIYG